MNGTNSEIAGRANAYYTRDDDAQYLCPEHEIWHDPSAICPGCLADDEEEAA